MSDVSGYIMVISTAAKIWQHNSSVMRQAKIGNYVQSMWYLTHICIATD